MSAKPHQALCHPCYSLFGASGDTSSEAIQTIVSNWLDRMEYLESSSLQSLLDQEKQEELQAFQTCSLTRRYNAIVKRVALMGIDTVNHLSRVGREKEADSIGNLLTDRFGRTLVAAFKPSLLGADMRQSEQSLPTG